MKNRPISSRSFVPVQARIPGETCTSKSVRNESTQQSVGVPVDHNSCTGKKHSELKSLKRKMKSSRDWNCSLPASKVDKEVKSLTITSITPMTIPKTYILTRPSIKKEILSKGVSTNPPNKTHGIIGPNV